MNVIYHSIIPSVIIGTLNRNTFNIEAQSDDQTHAPNHNAMTTTTTTTKTTTTTTTTTTTMTNDDDDNGDSDDNHDNYGMD